MYAGARAGGEDMPNDRHTPWDKEMQTRAMEIELYLAGKRAGTVAASGEWPQVTRQSGTIRSKGLRATQDLFGRGSAARNTGYCAGWIEGYRLCCVQLEGQRR